VGTYLALILVSLTVGYVVGSSSIPGSRGRQTEIPQTSNKNDVNEGDTTTGNRDGDLDRVETRALEECKLVSHLKFSGAIVVMF
jgi:hypothetical protein